jgi:hypothetical protein
MIKTPFYLVLFALLLSSCKTKTTTLSVKEEMPTTTADGSVITFPDQKTISFFKTKTVQESTVEAELAAPGKIAATILPSSEDAGQNIVLFDNSELAGNYTLLIQHQMNVRQIQNVNIKQKQIELDRVKDLQKHGAATGQDLLNAQTALSIEQTNLANEKAALIEHETKLKAGGFQPEILRQSPSGKAFIICDIPENQLNKITKGQNCSISFTAFPNQKFNGKIDGIADMIDNQTRMIKVRIILNNTDLALKSGMFAMVSFGVNEGNYINIDKNSLIAVQGKQYVFIKTAPLVFERREVQVGQQIGNRLIIFGGIKKGEEIASEGVMQLKGLSFGY